MHTITTSAYETLYEAFQDAKAHPMFLNESTTIICSSDEEMSELRGIAQNDEDYEGDVVTKGEEGRDMVDIWGTTHRSGGNTDYRIYLQLA